MSDVLKRLPDGVQGELHTVRQQSTRVGFANSELDGISDSSHQETTIRVIGDGRINSAVGSRPASEDDLMQRALQGLPYGSSAAFDFPGRKDVEDLELADPNVRGVGEEEMLEVAEDLRDSLADLNPRIRVNSGVLRQVQNVTLENTSGFEGEYERTMWRLDLSGRLVDGEDMLRLGESRSSSEVISEYEDLKEEVTWLFERAAEVVPMQSGTYPVVFAPAQVGFLVRPFVSCLMGNMVAAGMSPWKDKMDRQLLDERVTMVDDGTVPMRPSSVPFDREGVVTKKNVLIDSGSPRSFLLDLQSAGHLGLESTGNGSGGRGPGPMPHHLSLLPGEDSLSDVLASIRRGVVVFDTMGAWAGNPFSGNVSGTISVGFRIDEGEIVGRVKNCMFSLNAFEAFRESIIAFTAETRTKGSALGGSGFTFPYVALDEVVVATDR